MSCIKRHYHFTTKTFHLQTTNLH